MLSKEEVVRALREISPYLATEFGVSKIGLFGSYAKGNPNETSDVDIIVEFERPIGLRFVDLVEYLENLLGRQVDVLTPAGIQNIRIAQVAQSIRQSVLYV